MWVSLGLSLLMAAARTVVAFPQQFSSLAEGQQAQTETDRIEADGNVQNYNINGDFWWLQGRDSNAEKSTCPQDYDCVAEFQCVNGVVATDGEGSLNLRMGPSRSSTTTDLQSCSISEGTNNVCCRLPGVHEMPMSGESTTTSTEIGGEGQKAGSIGVVGLEEVDIAGDSPRKESSILLVSEQCDLDSDCTPVILCQNGEINVDGGYLIDVRIKPASNKACVNPEYPDVETVCCRIPESAPSTSTPALVTPALLTTCPGNHVCMLSNQCNADGTANTDGSDTIDIRIQTLQACVLAATSDIGVCCLPPPPPVFDTCPRSAVCISPGDCGGNAIDADFQLVPYTPDSMLWVQCPLNGTLGETGICCENPDPSTPVSLTTCPGQLECVLEKQCELESSVITDGTDLIGLKHDLNAKCYLEGSDMLGVCCRPPKVSVPVIDICPGSSVCIPDILCTGDALDNNEQFVPYNPTYEHWSQCSQFGSLPSPGVCCANPIIPTLPPSYPVATTCGIRNEGPSLLDTRISSPNAEAKFGEFPWQAIIFLSNHTFKCGATLIGERWLLTAAHCVRGLNPAEIHIRLGEWQVNAFDEPLAYVDTTVKAIHVHPRFNPRNVHNDVAVLEVAPLDGFSYHINAVCLPKNDDVSAERFAGKRCFATGWGKDTFEGNYQHILKKIHLPVVDHERCQSLLRKTRLGKYFILDKSFMCAGGEDNKDACKGDGGGPLVCEDTDCFYRLMGITAWGIGCGTKDVPGVYADVAALSDFINSIIDV